MFSIRKKILFSFISFLMILSLFAFLLATTTDRFISKKVTQVFSRVIAIILAGLSVQYIIDGIKSV